MSRNFTQYTSTASSPSASMPATNRGSPRPSQRSLMDNTPSNPLQADHQGSSPNRYYGGEPPGGALVGSAVNGSAEGQSGDESSSSSDADGDDDDADDNEDKPAVTSLAREKSKMPTRHSTDFEDLPLARPVKRTFEEAGLRADNLTEGVGPTEEEPDYPRKMTVKKISTTTQGILAYSFIDDDRVDDGYAIIDDDDDGEDENITDEEEAAIIDEFEGDHDEPTGVKQPDTGNVDPTVQDPGTAPFDNEALFDDLDGEIFDAMCNEPHRFDDLRDQSAFDWNPFTAESDNDLFSVNPTPVVTPRTSFSVPGQRTQQESITSDDEHHGASEDEVPDLSPFFEMGNAALRHLVSTEGKGGWSDETDDDADLLKYFFSSAEDSGSEFDGEDESEEDSMNGGETTDEEEDLPVPTPRNMSRLRRASVSSVAAVCPQIVDTNNHGPELCAWVADPSRPICVIEGSKQTFLIPSAYKRFSVGGESDSATSNQWIPMEESESERSSIPTFDPTFSGVEDRVLNGSDILGPPEAFYPFLSETGDQLSDLFNEDDDDVDEFEAGLEIDDFLDLSSAGEEVAAGKESQAAEGLSDDGEEGEDDEEDCVRVGDSSVDMLSIWDKVSVTAFRKRQIQHNQKLALASQYGNAGCHKGKESRLSETITPTKKRRVRQKFLASNRGGLVSNPTMRKKLSR